MTRGEAAVVLESIVRTHPLIAPNASADGSPVMGSERYRNPMKAVVDSGGRVLLPKRLRDSLGIAPGTTVDISAYGDGLRITAGGRVAVLARDDHGHLVATSDHPITDETVFGLIDAGRR